MNLLGGMSKIQHWLDIINEDNSHLTSWFREDKLGSNSLLNIHPSEIVAPCDEPYIFVYNRLGLYG